MPFRREVKMQVYNNEFYHFGVLGMKWGHHKSKNFDSYKESSVSIKTNKDGSKTIPKDFVFNRVGMGSLDVNSSGGLYVSHGKKDAARYIKALGPSTLRKLTGMAGTHVQHIKTKGDIKVPSDDQYIKTTNQILLKNKDIVKSLSDSVHSLTYTDDVEKSITMKDVEAAVNNPNNKESKKLAYAVSSMLGDPDYKKETKKIYDLYKKEGYDAIPDIHDRYDGTSETATIIINTDKVQVSSTTEITRDIYKSGKQYVKQIGNLKVNEIMK